MLSNHTPWSKNLDLLPEFEVDYKYEKVNEKTKNVCELKIRE